MDLYCTLSLKKRKMKQIIERLTAPTPNFFKKLRNFGLALTAISAVVVGSPVALPVIVVKVAGYLAVAGGIVGAVSQTAVQGGE